MNQRWVEEASAALAECEFKDYSLQIAVSHTGYAYIQAVYDEICTVKGVVEAQYTRRWLITPTMTWSEIVSTAFKCVLTSMEHRTREGFKYRGRTIYMPHYDVDTLHAVCVDEDVRAVCDKIMAEPERLSLEDQRLAVEASNPGWSEQL